MSLPTSPTSMTTQSHQQSLTEIIRKKAYTRIRNLQNGINGDRIPLPTQSEHWIPLLVTYLRLPNLDDSWIRLLDCWRMERSKSLRHETTLVNFADISSLIDSLATEGQDLSRDFILRIQESAQISHIVGRDLSATNFADLTRDGTRLVGGQNFSFYEYCTYSNRIHTLLMQVYTGTFNFWLGQSG